VLAAIVSAARKDYGRLGLGRGNPPIVALAPVM
jgi:hypothetical protein